VVVDDDDARFEVGDGTELEAKDLTGGKGIMVNDEGGDEDEGDEEG